MWGKARAWFAQLAEDWKMIGEVYDQIAADKARHAAQVTPARITIYPQRREQGEMQHPDDKASPGW